MNSICPSMYIIMYFSFCICLTILIRRKPGIRHGGNEIHVWNNQENVYQERCESQSRWEIKQAKKFQQEILDKK